MSSRFPALAALCLLLSGVPSVAPGADSPGTPPRRNITYIRGIPDTSSYFLSDTVVLARVNGRPFRVREYVETYYNSYGEDRPASDSAGRVEWLNSMINKEIVGTVARRAAPAFGFEERQVMREHTQRALSNVVFQRLVLDSIRVSEEEAHRRYERLKTEYHLRHILMTERGAAERVRGDLDAGRMSWKDAVAKYSIARNDSGPEGDLGWLAQAVDVDQPAIFSLAPGRISPVLDDPAGFQIVQLLASRPVEPPAWEGIRGHIAGLLVQRQTRERSERLIGIMRVQSGMHYDTANIQWASSRYRPKESRNPGALGIRLQSAPPVMAPADTSRVLARWREGRLTVAAFNSAYSDLSPFARPDVSTFEGFLNFVDAVVLEPYKARMAVERGLDKDSLAVAMIEKKREQLMVEHMYRDSVESKLYVGPAERRKYYQSHLAQFMTYPTVRYAILARPDSASAHALVARLEKGEKAEDIQRADSLAGIPSKLRVEPENGTGAFHVLLFEDLKPGRWAVQGPDEKGVYAVVQSLAFDPGRQLSFEESDRYADENLRTELSEKLFNQLIARHRRHFRIEAHPELVMRIKLIDPAAESL